jgi:eukaryotic-like serine/threonine-protein kinase
MNDLVGKTILHYTIIEQVGQGGMGKVYKAQDTKLDRLVALKFLPSPLLTTKDEKDRFILEAKTASAINHPNICTIYDVQETPSAEASEVKFDSQLFIVMEYVDGKTLKEKKNLSEKQMLEIGIQVAEGLAVAHEKGIVHRDIKPENIMVRQDGITQIMDFGLSKLYSAENTSRLTKSGTIMGTARYMSPEQIQGFDVDYRSDIFSLGIILYELFTGKSPFKGMHETAIMFQIVNSDVIPPIQIKKDINPALDELILECLEKDKDERCQSAKELAKNLRKLKGSSGKQGVELYKAKSIAKERENGKSLSTNSYLKLFSYVSLLIISFIVLYLIFWNKPAETFNHPVYFSFDIPGKSNPLLGGDRIFQVSPNGESIAYTDKSNPTTIIYIRKLGNLAAYPVTGTEGGKNPVFENNNWLSFTVNYFARRVPVTGGIPKISRSEYENDFDWGTNGEIVSSSWVHGLVFQSGWNGKEETLTEFDSTENEGAHVNPFVLPGNKAAVFNTWSEKMGTFDNSKIVIVDLKSKERKNLKYNDVDLQGTSPQFIQTSWGSYLLCYRGGNLYASLFDLNTLKISGPETKIFEGISANDISGRAAYSVTNANNGTIAYIAGKLETIKVNLVWYNENSTQKKAFTADGLITAPRFIKDDRAVVSFFSPVLKIGLIDFKKDKIDLLFSKGDNVQPIITPDGSNFIFSSDFEDGKYNIYMSRLDGLGGVKKIVSLEQTSFPEISNLSPDGRYILYNDNYNFAFGKIWIKDIKSDREPKLLFNTKANVTSPEFSPDGKLICYRSDEIDGTPKLFLRPFPINDIKIQVSINNAINPQWSTDGTKLYYRSGNNIMVAKIQVKPDLKVLWRKVVCYSEIISPDFYFPDFSVYPDGRILLLKNVEDESKPIKVNVIVNWFTELKKKLSE